MDVKAIIFLAPISVFDERIEGEGGLNRLEDSIKFWTTICKSKLLAKVFLDPRSYRAPRTVPRGLTNDFTQVELILCLNKCDILARKLARGVSMRRHITTYGDRANDLPTASKCMSSLRASRYYLRKTHAVRNIHRPPHAVPRNRAEIFS